jgi:hypothetical protein
MLQRMKMGWVASGPAKMYEAQMSSGARAMIIMAVSHP